jgi:hypothetical protein
MPMRLLIFVDVIYLSLTMSSKCGREPALPLGRRATTHSNVHGDARSSALSPFVPKGARAHVRTLMTLLRTNKSHQQK